MSLKISPWKQDWAVWTGLVLLFVGLLLADRSFARWRNDERHFPDANGTYHEPDPETHPGPRSNPVVLRTMAFTGLGLMAVSVVLLNKRES